MLRDYVHPKRIFVYQKPFYQELYDNNQTEELLSNLQEIKSDRPLTVIVTGNKQWGYISSSPKNKKQRYTITNFGQTYCPLREILSDYCKQHNREILVLQLPSPNGGVDVWYIDKHGIEPMNDWKNYKLVSSAITTSVARRLNRKKVKKLENYEELAKLGLISPLGLDIVKSKLIKEIDWKEESEFLRKNKEEVKKVLEDIFRTLSEIRPELHVYTPHSKSSYVYKLLSNVIESSDLQNVTFRYKKWNEQSRLPSQRLISFLNYLSGRNYFNTNKISDYFADEIEYCFPPNYIEEGNFFSMLHDENGNLVIKKSGLYPIVDDKQNWVKYYKKYFNNNKADFETIRQATAYVPIEALIIEELERTGNLRPYPVKNLNSLKFPNVDERVAIHVSTLVAPCTFQKLASQLRIDRRDFYTEDEWKRISKGTMLHKLILENEEKGVLAHELVTLLFDNKLTFRNSYTEVPLKGKINDVPIVGRADVVMIHENRIVIGDLKSTIAFPEVYKKRHAFQVYIYGRLLYEALKPVKDIALSDMHILFYQGVTSSEPKTKTKKRYVHITEDVESTSVLELEMLYKIYKEALKHPEDTVKHVLNQEYKRDCSCVKNNDVLEKKRKIMLEELKKRKLLFF